MCEKRIVAFILDSKIENVIPFPAVNQHRINEEKYFTIYTITIHIPNKGKIIINFTNMSSFYELHCEKIYNYQTYPRYKDKKARGKIIVYWNIINQSLQSKEYNSSKSKWLINKTYIIFDSKKEKE